MATRRNDETEAERIRRERWTAPLPSVRVTDSGKLLLTSADDPVVKRRLFTFWKAEQAYDRNPTERNYQRLVDLGLRSSKKELSNYSDDDE